MNVILIFLQDSKFINEKHFIRNDVLANSCMIFSDVIAQKF